MTPRASGRTQTCGAAEARVRAAQARAFLDTAELVVAADDELATPGVAAALAVLAGVAASDAACCAALGRRSRGLDHRQATTLLAQVEPDGQDLSHALGRLLDVKDGAHYGMVYLSAQRARAALRNARRLVEAAEAVVRR